MSDVLTRFLVMARRRDRSVLRRFFFTDEPWLQAGVEQLVESAAARVSVTSQHEKVSHRDVTVPASRRHSVRFYDVARPNRPVAGTFVQRSESFPLQRTLSVRTCGTCGGRGQVTCGSCSGRGRDRCSSCGGRKRSSRGRCAYCGGSGQSRCRSCQGSGEQTCSTCSGEGRVASWREEVYAWRIERRRAEQFPLEKTPGRVRRAFKKWLKIDEDTVADLRSPTAADHLGYDTPEAMEVVARAEQDRLRLEDEAKKSRQRYLFHSTVRCLVPVGYSVVRRASRASYFWVVGRGSQAVSIEPFGRPDRGKILGWLGLGSAAVLAREALAQSLAQVFWWSPLFASLSLFDSMPLWQLLAGLEVSLALAMAGVLRNYARKPRTQVVAVLHETGEPTPLLACLAHLGSYTNHLSVVDRAYTTQTERLLGRPRSEHQSESLTVELADGRKVYLIEVARPQELSDDQLEHLLGTLDGVVILEDAKSPPDEGPATLEARVRALAADRVRISEARIDGDPDVALESAGARDQVLPLESVRAAFVGRFHSRVDWVELFRRLWRPVGRLLDGGAADDRPADTAVAEDAGGAAERISTAEALAEGGATSAARLAERSLTRVGPRALRSPRTPVASRMEES